MEPSMGRGASFKPLLGLTVHHRRRLGRWTRELHDDATELWKQGAQLPRTYDFENVITVPAGACGGLEWTQPKCIDSIYPATLEEHVLVLLPNCCSRDPEIGLNR